MTRELPLEMPAWSLNLLGRFQLADAGGRNVQLSSRKTMGLVALLALAPGQTLRREQAIALLWSDRGTEQGRGSLRQTLVALKRETGVDRPPLVESDGEVLRLDPGTVRTDVGEFLTLAKSEDATSLRHAAGLYQGHLAEGLSIADEAFEEWLRQSRDRLQDRAIALFTQLSQLEQGAARVAVARRLVALDPLREASQGALIEALSASGDAASAIRQYETCRALLKAELGIEPSPELVALNASLHAKPLPVDKDTAARPAKPSVAVLPFDNLDGDPAQRYFSDGISEDIINGLSRFSALFVIARHSSFRFRESAAGTRAIAEQLGVRYLVAGSVRRSSERIRITAQLIDAVTGSNLWSERHDREMQDVFAIQDEVASLIVATLTGRMQEAEIRAARSKPTDNLQAYDCLLCGIDYLRSYGEGVNRRAIDMFEKAISLDPRYGLAHGLLGLALLVEYKFANAPLEIKGRALACALEGVRLAPDEARCHQFLGDAHLYGQRNLELAIVHYQRSIALNPDDANGLVRLGLALTFAGRATEGVAAIRQAMRNNPLHPDYYWGDLAIAAYTERDYQLALEANRRMVSHGRYWDAARYAACLAQLGRLDEARAEAQRVLGMKPDFHLASECLLYEDPTDAEHVKDGMRKAGLPE